MPDLSRTSTYEYSLPPERIARYPAPERDASRLLVLSRRSEEGDRADTPGGFQDRRFSDLTHLIAEGDLVVVNESRVLPARLLGRKPTGAECEVLLLRPISEEGETGVSRKWQALVRPGSKLKPGRRVLVSDDLSILIEEGSSDGGRVVRLESERPIGQALAQHGKIPLPPYLNRTEEPLDRERYQTVYAREPGSVAAPTAGLHFTPKLLESLTAKGAEIARVTLHVGPGTFRPVASETIEGHEMHREWWHIPPETVESVGAARARGGRIWAVGTTVVRTLETAADRQGSVRAGNGTTGLFITPGFRFRVVDALITNFHLPRSTLLMLVAAFAGYDQTMRAYAHAIHASYRFYSYGDAMAVIPKQEKHPL